MITLRCEFPQHHSLPSTQQPPIDFPTDCCTTANVAVSKFKKVISLLGRIAASAPLVLEELLCLNNLTTLYSHLHLNNNNNESLNFSAHNSFISSLTDSIVRAFPQDKTAAALSEIRKTLTFLDRLGQAPELPDKLHDHLKTINQHLQGLRTLRFGTDAYLRLQQKLRQIRKIAAPLDPSNITWDAALAKDRTAPQVEKLARSAGDLKSLHTDLAQRAAQRDPLDLPAYSLDHDDE